MRRSIGTVAGSLAFVVTVGVPEVSAQALHAGVEFGTSHSTFGGEGVGSLDGWRRGVMVGLTLGYDLGSTVRIETGARWVQKGAEGTLLGFEEPVSAEVRLAYVQVPLLLRLDPLHDRTLRPVLSMGSSISFEVDCRMDTDPSVLALLVFCEDEERARTDVGLLFGGGVAWRVGRADVLLEGRYDLGLHDLDTIDAREGRTRSFTLGPRVSVAVGR